MTKTYGFGTFAAIGGLTATIALLAGLPAVSADELADLRANQERLRANQDLIQHRIEQLAQGRDPKRPARRRRPRGLWHRGGAGCPDGGGQLPALVPDPGNRHLDPRRRPNHRSPSITGCRTARQTASRAPPCPPTAICKGCHSTSMASRFRGWALGRCPSSVGRGSAPRRRR